MGGRRSVFGSVTVAVAAMSAVAVVIAVPAAERVSAVSTTRPITHIPVNEIKAVDTTGRFVLVPGSTRHITGRPNDVRFDRLTGAAVDLPRVMMASADLRWAVTFGSDGRGSDATWRNIDTGATYPVPVPATGGDYVQPWTLSADGDLLFGRLVTHRIGYEDSRAVVATRSGVIDVAPIESSDPVDMSANGRWVLFSSPCALCSEYFRWDRQRGTAQRIAIGGIGGNRYPFAIGDDGRVIETEFLSGDPFQGGATRVVARSIDGGMVELIGPSDQAQRLVTSDDGSLLTFFDSLSRLVLVDTLTGQRMVDPSLVADVDRLAVGGTGAVVLTARPAPAVPPPNQPTVTTNELITVAVPGRLPLPRLAADEVYSLPVAGVRGVPADATSAVLNVTVTNPAGPGFATVWPCDEPRPLASNVNFTAAGTTVANAVVAKIASTGASAGSVCLAPSTEVDVIVDVQGFFTGGAYSGIAPDRFLDTRNGETDLVPNKAAGEEFTVPVAGVRGVPADATAAVLNVTVTNSAGPGFVTVWPCDETRPLASNVNVTGAGQTVANAVVAKLAATGASAGSVCVSGSTAVDVIVDVQGYVTGDAYSGLAPDRFLDTRNGDTDAVPNVAAGAEVPLPLAGVRGVPADAGAVVVNVTVTNPAGPGFVTVWPCDEPRPLASNVNFSAAGATVANAVVAKVATSGPSAGSICLYGSTGVDVIVDVQGSFTGVAYTGIAPDRFLDTRD